MRDAQKVDCRDGYRWRQRRERHTDETPRVALAFPAPAGPMTITPNLLMVAGVGFAGVLTWRFYLGWWGCLSVLCSAFLEPRPILYVDHHPFNISS